MTPRPLISLAAAVAAVSVVVAAAGPALAAPAGRPPAGYTVRPGDTLWDIARRHGTTTSALARANGLELDDVLLAGDVLELPGQTATTPTATRSSGTTHVVRPDDTLWDLAQRYGTSIPAIAAANGKSATSLLFVGERLVVPAGSQASAPATSTGSRSTSASASTAVRATVPASLRARPERLTLVPTFRAAAREFGVPVDLLMSLAYLESGWRSTAYSADGAIGIGQLLPSTARWVAAMLREPGLDPWDPEDNIRMSARFLKYLLGRFGGDEVQALASYYQGPVAVERSGVSPGGRTYASIILGNRQRFR